MNDHSARILRFLCLLAFLSAAPAPPPAPSPNAVTEAVCLEVHDGDTALCELQYSEQTHELVMLRLKGVAAAELWAPGGKEARAKLAKVMPEGSRVIVRRFPVKSDKPWGPRYEKSFERFIAEVWRDGVYVNGAVK